MTQPNLPAAGTADQPDHFAEIAAEMHRAADDIATLVGSGHPKPTHVGLDIHAGGPRGDRDDDQTASAVDALGLALLGTPGTANKMYDGTYHYGTKSTRRGPITVHVYDSVSTAWAVKRAAVSELAAKEVELERLRAEVAELRAAQASTKAGFVDGPCGDPDCPNASWPHPASSDLAAPDPSGLGYSREPEPTEVAPVPADVEGHAEGRAAGIPKHYETGRWDGGVGYRRVECACGISYDGFATLDDALVVLDAHIAERNAAPDPS